MAVNMTTPMDLTFQVSTQPFVVMNETGVSTVCDNRTQAVPDAPLNLTLLGIFTTTVLLQWNMTCDLDSSSSALNSFSIHVHPVTSDWMNDADLLAFVVTLISWDTRQYTLQNLIPQTLYNVHLTSVNSHGSSNASDILSFRTLSATPLDHHRIVVKPIEVVLVFGILSAWFMTIVMFLRKWGTIRISQPGGHSKYQQPKNLDTIKVVNTANDSVIYRNYGQDYHKTMQARQNRLDKMHTVPNIKFKNVREKKAQHSSHKKMYVKSSSMLDKTVTEHCPKPGLGSNVTPSIAAGLKLKPRLNANMGSIESHVMDMFPEALLEQSDKEDSIDNLSLVEKKLDPEQESTSEIKGKDKLCGEVQCKEITSTDHSQALVDSKKDSHHSETSDSESRQGNTNCTQQLPISDSTESKQGSDDSTIEIKQNLCEDESNEDIYRSTTV